MSWRGVTLERTNDILINELKASSYLTSPGVEAVMRRVDRRNYCPTTDPYADCPQPIGYKATISAPHMHAMALEMLETALREGPRRRALDVGAGSGYITACMALLQGDNGLVVGIEHLPQLAELAQQNVNKDHPDLLEQKRVHIVVGDGRLGWPAEAPFDVIHVGAAAPKEPEELLRQLALGGTMVVPIGELGNQWQILVRRSPDGRLQYERKEQVAFVPLTDATKQWSAATTPPPPPLPKSQQMQPPKRRPSALLTAEDLAVIEASRDSDPDSDDERDSRKTGVKIKASSKDRNRASGSRKRKDPQ